jgi:hypothetical protein
MGYAITQGNTTTPLVFSMVLAADHLTPAPGLVPTVLLSKNGFPFVPAQGAVVEIGLGSYRVEANAVDAASVGPLLLHASAATADVTLEEYTVEAPAAEPVAPTPGESVTVTAIGLIKLALQTIGKLAAGEAPAGEITADSYTVLNEMLDNWRTQKLLIPHLVRVTYPLEPGKTTYTVGPGGDIDLATPFGVRFAFVQDPSNPGYERQIGVLNEEALAQRVQKTVTGAPVTEVYYQATFPLGTLTVPATIGVGTLVLYLLTGLPAFATLTEPYILMPGYAKALRYNLAIQLAPFHGVSPDPLIYDEARASIADIKRLNIRHHVLSNYFQDNRGAYNIYTDEFYR